MRFTRNIEDHNIIFQQHIMMLIVDLSLCLLSFTSFLDLRVSLWQGCLSLSLETTGKLTNTDSWSDRISLKSLSNFRDFKAERLLAKVLLPLYTFFLLPTEVLIWTIRSLIYSLTLFSRGEDSFSSDFSSASSSLSWLTSVLPPILLLITLILSFHLILCLGILSDLDNLTTNRLIDPSLSSTTVSPWNLPLLTSFPATSLWIDWLIVNPSSICA